LPHSSDDILLGLRYNTLKQSREF